MAQGFREEGPFSYRKQSFLEAPLVCKTTVKLKPLSSLQFDGDLGGFPGGSDGKESACNARGRVGSLGQEEPLEKETATHSSILAWRIPWTGAWWATVHEITKS